MWLESGGGIPQKPKTKVTKGTKGRIAAINLHLQKSFERGDFEYLKELADIIPDELTINYDKHLRPRSVYDARG